MKPHEIDAFVDAYDNTICNIPSDRVKEFVRLYMANESIEDFIGYEYTSIVDALGMWNYAIKWKLQQLKEGVEA